MGLAAAVVASVITVAIYIPYLLGIWRGSLRPHVISWVIWGITTLLAGIGQWLAGAGIGAAPIALSGLFAFSVALLAWSRRRHFQIDLGITRGDTICLFIALSCIPLWILTGDELWSVLILTLLDLIGFIPTIRLIWRDPYAESLLMFIAFAIRNGVAVIAVDHMTVTTVVFPGAIGIGCAVIVCLILLRRMSIKRKEMKLIS